jgi:hypothetical protein
MSDTPTIQDIQRRTIRLMNHEDGLWDLLLGAVFMLLADYRITRAWLGPTWNLGHLIGLMVATLASQTVLRRVFALPDLATPKANVRPSSK